MNLGRLLLIFSVILAAHHSVYADELEGKKSFGKCIACHSVAEGQTKIGPSLYRVYGRKAGSLSNYNKYSEAMKKSGVIWDDAKLTEFLTNPKLLIPNTTMTFLGVKNPDEIKNIIAYIKTLK